MVTDGPEPPPPPMAAAASRASTMTEWGLSDESDIHDEQDDLRTWPGGAVPVLVLVVFSRRVSARSAAVAAA